MKRFTTYIGSVLIAVVFAAGVSFGQDNQTADSDVTQKVTEQVKDIGETLNQSQTVQEVSAGILQPIYQAAEYMSFSSFYWVAFTIMTIGVVSFALQLVLAKFFLLFKGSLNIREILADFLGLLISAVGLVLTTQAAAQNSNFTESSLAVISATAVGVIVGFVFYWWGQKQEFRAVDGARKPTPNA